MHPFSPEISPPGAVIELPIQNPRNSKSIKCNFLIDTGTDITCIPNEVVGELNLSSYKTIKAYDYNDQVELRNAFYVNLKVGEYQKTISVISVSGNIGFLGRDVLKDFVLIINGPKQQYDFTNSGEESA